MRITVLGGSGAWPTAEEPCSGFLVEHEGFTVLVDAGYATFPRLLAHLPAERLDAVLISHGHPDHCADLNPLLRARSMSAEPPGALPVFAPTGALRAVLALDRPGMLDDALDLREFEPGGPTLTVGPFAVETALLPHWVPNAGMRLSAGGAAVVYTGDAGPDPALVHLASGADVLIAEATYPDHVPAEDARYLTSARQAAEQATRADVGRLLLTHLWPGVTGDSARDAAAKAYSGPLDVAVSGLVVEV